MLLSVIVPVYNAGEYLRPCLLSLLDLPIEKEIIVVDDGSTDEAVERVAESDMPLTVIRQSNQGVSVARNAGLQIAKGDWIWFVDADDQIIYDEKSSRPEAYDALRSDAQKLLLLPFYWEEDGRQTSHIAQNGEIPYNLWRCFFNRKAIESRALRFTPGRKYAEDQEFILKYLLQVSSDTVALEGPTYHYTMRPSGAMKKKGTLKKQRWDVWCVLCTFSWKAIITGQITKTWVLKQIKRIIKTLSILCD